MYISKVEIKNYRGIGNKGFTLNLKPFTLIIGENNIGKTNVLKAIQLILDQDIKIYRSRMLENDDINKETLDEFRNHIFDKNIDPENIIFPEVQISLEFKELNDVQAAVLGDWFIDSSLSTASITFLYKIRSGFNKIKWINALRTSGKTMYSFPIRDYEYILYGGNSITNKCNQYLMSFLKLDYLDALRDASLELSPSNSSNLIYRVLNSIDNSNYTDLSEAMTVIDNSIKDNDTLNEIKNEIEGVLSKISLDYEEDKTLEFKFSTPTIKDLIKKIGLGYGTNELSIIQNGLGSNNLLYISLILSKFCNTNYFGKNSVFRLIGIEEPEAHLHIHLQEHISKNIKDIRSHNKECQIIMTSHSTSICGTLDLESTVILYKEGNEVQSHYIFDGFTNLAEDKRKINFLKRYLDATKTPMFFARKIILVEGIAELMVIPALFEYKYKKTLTQCGISIINVNGVAFRNFLDIIKNGYFIKCCVLTDGDLGTATENRADNLISDYSSYPEVIKILKNTETFEKEIMEVNKTSKTFEIIMDAYKETRPNKGGAYKKNCSLDNGKLNYALIEIQEIFDGIKDYKAEFSSSLSNLLSIEDMRITIPEYIKEALEFVYD